MSRDPLTKEQMEAMNFEKVWISYGVDENGVEDGEWGVILFGRLYSIDALEGAGMEELLQDLSNGESLSDAEMQHRVYSAWLPGTAWYWGQVVQDLKRLKVETGSLACLGCKRERQCATKGCFIIREALCLLGVSDLDTVHKQRICLRNPGVEASRMNKKELRLYLAIAKAEEAAIHRRLRQYRGPIGGARNLLRMSAYKGIVRVLLELELTKYADIRVPKFEAGKVPSGRNIYVSVADECHALMTRNRLRGDVIV